MTRVTQRGTIETHAYVHTLAQTQSKRVEQREREREKVNYEVEVRDAPVCDQGSPEKRFDWIS